MQASTRHLVGTSKDAAFEILRGKLSRTPTWILQDDTLPPSGDYCGESKALYSFDLDQDILFYSAVELTRETHLQLPLDRLRQKSSADLQFSKFTPFDPPSSPQLDLTGFPPPYRQPSTPTTDHRLLFTSRILSDFSYQWRYILRRPNRECTFLRLARAIVSIATCDFEVREVTRQGSTFGVFYVVKVDNLPSWKPYKSRLFTIGGTTIVLDQDLRTALKDARVNAEERRRELMNSGDRMGSITYLLLSIRHMMLCHATCDGSFSYTAPTTLLDGVDPPSPKSIQLLLQALAPASQPPPRTPVHNLPLKVQDRILRHVSEGPIEAARLGCLLDLGSPFTWLRSHDPPRSGGSIELLTAPSQRTEFTPVDSDICVGRLSTGVSYR